MHYAAFLVRLRRGLSSAFLGSLLGLAALSACAQAQDAAQQPAQSTAPAQAAGLDESTLTLLASDDNDEKIEAIVRLGRMADPRASALLQALADEHVYVTGEGGIFISEDDGQTGKNPLSGAAQPMPEGADTLTINNRVRSAIEAAQATAKLHSPVAANRLAAAQSLLQSGDESLLAIVDEALKHETDAGVRTALQTIQARLQLSSADPATRRAAVQTLGESGNASYRPMLSALVQPKADGGHAEPDASVREAASAALKRIEQHMTQIGRASCRERVLSRV